MHTCHQTYQICKQAICRIACVTGAWKYLGEKKERLRERETRSLARPFLSFLGWIGRD